MRASPVPPGPTSGPARRSRARRDGLVWSQVDAGHTCPVSMSYAAVPALRAQPALAARWEPLLRSPAYDSSYRPATEKAGRCSAWP